MVKAETIKKRKSKTTDEVILHQKNHQDKREKIEKSQLTLLLFLRRNRSVAGS
jgi:hypothetical protein